MDNLLADTVSVVTGGSSGIGRAIAARFAEQGSDIAILDIREEPREGGTPTADLVREEGRESYFVHCDVSDIESIEAAIDTVRDRFGRIDVLVNNAGVFRSSPFIETTPAEFDDVFDINVRGYFFTSQLVAKHMIERSTGTILNVSSTAGLYGSGDYVAYCASKGAIRLMTYAQADALGPHDIRVNAIHPGVVETEMSREDSEVVETAAGETFLDRIPLGSFGSPDDIADAALYLASDLGGYVTGESLVVDGGIHNTK